MIEDETNVIFYEHPTFSKELTKFSKRYNDNNCFKHLKNLLNSHFNPISPVLCIGQNAMKEVNNTGNNIMVMKVEMSVKGLRHGQYPRIYFWKVGNAIYFLCFGSHINNYSDSKMRSLVFERIKYFDSNITFN